MPLFRRLAALMVLPAFAAGFSLFSLQGDPYAAQPGDWVSRASVRMRGMGGAGLALADSIHYTNLNPASYASLDYTLISITWSPEITDLAEAAGPSLFRGFDQDFPNAELAIPLGRFGALFCGFKRDRLLDYDVHYEDAQGYGVHRFGRGGTWIAQGGYALSFGKYWSAGFSAGQMYGRSITGTALETLPGGASRLEPSVLQKTDFNAGVADVGVLFRSPRFSVGLSGSLPLTATTVLRNAQIIQHYTATDSNITPLTYETEEDLVPMGFAAGGAYAPIPRLKIALDGQALRFKAPEERMETRVSGGLEYRFTENRSEHYYLNIPLRAGAFYRDLGNADAVTETGAAFGFTLPTLGHFGYLHAAIEAGRRRSDAASLTETFYRGSLQLVHKGRWGRLRKSSTSDF